MSKTRPRRTVNADAVSRKISTMAPVNGENTLGFWRRSIARISRKSMAFKILSGVTGMALVGGAAYGVTNWVVGLSAGSSGEGQAASVSNISISAVASPAAPNQLFPGGVGDVVAIITNPNGFPVTLTGVNLPTNLIYAGGFTTSSLATAQTGCSTSTSDVVWNFATGTSGSAHTLSSALIIAANGTLTVTLTNDASMTASAPAACENTYFSMPALTGIAATGGAATPTSSPTTDGWTS